MRVAPAIALLAIGNSWAASLARIDTRMREVSYVPLPNARGPMSGVPTA